MRIIIIAILTLLLTSSSNGDEILNYLTNNNLIKYNITKQKLMKTLAVDEISRDMTKGWGDLVIDEINNRIILSEYDDNEVAVFVYEATTMKLLKQIEWPKTITAPVACLIVYPQNSDKFYIQVNDVINKVETTLAYSKTNYSYIGQVKNIYGEIKNVTFSKINSSGSVIKQENRQVVSVDLNSFVETPLLDLSNLPGNVKSAKSLYDEYDGKLLLMNFSGSLGGRLYYYIVYDYINNKMLSNQQLTGINNRSEMLFVNQDGVVVNEVNIGKTYTTVMPIGGFENESRLHKFSISTGAIAASSPLNRTYGGRLLAKKVYKNKLPYLTFTENNDIYNLNLIDVASMSIIQTISVDNIGLVYYTDELDESPASTSNSVITP